MGFPPVQPNTIVILGAGRFGRLAAKRLPVRYPQASLIIVDRDAARLENFQGTPPVEKVQQDALAFLESLEPTKDLWIVPAIPVHVAWQWILCRLRRIGSAHPLPVPVELDHHVPHPLRTPAGTLYASFADFRCPDNCPEPDKICTFTGKPRQGILHQHLARLSAPGHRIHVLRSRQMAPGVGGYTLDQMQEILRAVKAHPGAHILATSCSCHAVLDGLAWYGKGVSIQESGPAAMEDSRASK